MMEVRHPRSLDFANERKVVLLRDIKGLTWDEVAAAVVNLQGEPPGVRTMKRVYSGFSAKLGRRPLMYGRCGRKAWKCTPAVQAFLVGRLRALRRASVCTAATLQVELARERGVHLEQSTIRKVLRWHGYRWLPRAQKPAVDKDLAARRMQFAKKVARMSKAQLREEMSMSMDGVVLSRPPVDPVERANYCKQGITHMYRKPGEAAHPELAGDDPYPDQIPASRCIPMWGGISEGGCAVVTFHKNRKITGEEWVKVVRARKLREAVTSLRPVRRRGPWKVLCDGEKFLWSKQSKKACAEANITLWQVPPKSPDMNPVEKFWGWLRRQLLHRDLADLRARRPVLGAAGYRARVRAIIRTQKAREKAAKFAGDLRRVCKEVIRKKGARVR